MFFIFLSRALVFRKERKQKYSRTSLKRPVTTCVVPCCHESSSYILSSIVHTANMVIRECVSGCLQEVRNNGKSLTVGPKKWSRSLTGGGRLLEAPTVRH